MKPGTVPVRWSKEPEKREWMLENGGGRPISDVRRDFEERFGHPISQTQVSLFRAEYGLARRRGNRTAHKKLKPIGTERVTKGYVFVKVRELPTKPQSKDNWVYKQVLVWERTRGLKLPDGWMVLFCDHDSRNFDPANLKAVPREIIGVLNSGHEWHDRATLETAVAAALLRRGIARVCQKPRRCVICGRVFTPDNKGTAAARSQITCRECLDKGLTSYGRRKKADFGTGICAVCGKPFKKTSGCQKYCVPCCPYIRISKKEKR